MRASIRRYKGNISLRDEDYSPAEALDRFWADCPKLAALQNPAFAHWYRNHFHDYTIADWIITTTETGGGTATEALADELGGVLLLTTDDQDNESTEFQKNGEAFQIVPGKPFWFEARIKISEATQSDFLVGLCITDTTLIDGMSDGVFFQKDDGDANIDFHCIKDSGETASNGDTGVDLVAAAYNRFGIKSVKPGVVEYWLDGVKRAEAAANVPDDELLCPSFAIQNGDGNARTLAIDFLEGFQVL